MWCVCWFPLYVGMLNRLYSNRQDAVEFIAGGLKHCPEAKYKLYRLEPEVID